MHGYKQLLLKISHSFQESSYSAMLYIPESVPHQEAVPTILEFDNSNSEPSVGIPCNSGIVSCYTIDTCLPSHSNIQFRQELTIRQREN